MMIKNGNLSTTPSSINPYMTKKNQTSDTINDDAGKKNSINSIFGNQGRKNGDIQDSIKQAIAKTDFIKHDSGQQKNNNVQNSSDQNKRNQTDANKKDQAKGQSGESLNPSDYQDETEDTNQIPDYTPDDFSNVFTSNQISKDQSINSNEANDNGSALAITSTIPAVISTQSKENVTDSTASTVTSSSVDCSSNLISKPDSSTDSSETVDKKLPDTNAFSGTTTSLDHMKISQKSSDVTKSGGDDNNRGDLSDEQFKGISNTESNSFKDITTNDGSYWDAKAKMAGQNQAVMESTSNQLNEINKYTTNKLGMIATDSAGYNGSNVRNDAGEALDNSTPGGGMESNEVVSSNANALLEELEAQQTLTPNNYSRQASSTFNNLGIQQSTNKLANDSFTSKFPSVNIETNPMNDLDNPNNVDIGVGFTSSGSNTPNYPTTVQEDKNNKTQVNSGVQGQNLDDQPQKNTIASVVKQFDQSNPSSIFTSFVTGNPKDVIVEGR